MITRDDIADALSKASAYDRQHVPKASRVLIEAWLEHFERFAPAVQREELLTAVTEYHREPHDRMLQPADLSSLARIVRRDQFERSPLESPDRAALESCSDIKAADDVRAITSGFVDGATEDETPRLTAAREAARSSYGREDARSAIRELFAAKRAAKQVTVHGRSVEPAGAGGDPLTVECSWCRAGVGEPCRSPSTGLLLTKSRVHSSRIDTAERSAIPVVKVAADDGEELF